MGVTGVHDTGVMEFECFELLIFLLRSCCGYKSLRMLQYGVGVASKSIQRSSFFSVLVLWMGCVLLGGLLGCNVNDILSWMELMMRRERIILMWRCSASFKLSTNLSGNDGIAA